MRVAIIGGGFAGLAAGVDLARRGAQVELFEARAHLGGRAYSFTDAESGESVDNGQHALLGCYTHTLAFLRQIGAGGKLRRQRNLRVELRDARRGCGVIACLPLPAPLHLLGGVLRYRLLSMRERVRVLRGGLQLMALRRGHDPRLSGWTVAEALAAVGQSVNACDSFWYPVAVAALNESPRRAAAAPFAEVLARAFFGARRDSQFVLPAVGLSELYTADARRCIEAHGGRVHLKAAAAALAVADGRVTGVRLRDGRTICADACISAVPPRALTALLPSPLLGLRRSLSAFEPSPIVSAHLWFDRPVLHGDFVGLLGTTAQWAFDRSRLLGHRGPGGARCVSAVVSAGRALLEWSPERVAAAVVADLRAVFPSARAASLLRWIVVKEKQATISPTPAAERLRPPAATAIPNFVLAGDWIATGLPPTIESAVASGRRAAACVAGLPVAGGGTAH